MNYQEIINNLKKDNISSLYLFTGNEEYIFNILIKQIKQKFMDSSLETFNFNKFQGEDMLTESFTNAVQTLPLGAPKRVILVQDSDKYFKTLSKSAIEDVLKVIRNIPAETIIIFSTPNSIDKRSKIYKTLKKHGDILELNKITRKELFQWIKRKLDRELISYKPSNIEYLINESMYFEIEKLTIEDIDNYINQIIYLINENKTISNYDISSVLPNSMTNNTFKIIDNINSNQRTKAIQILEQMIQSGEEPLRVFGLLCRETRLLLEVKFLINNNLSEKQIAKKLNLHPYVCKNFYSKTKKYDISTLKKFHIDITDIDFQIKKGVYNPEFALQWVILNF
jgi:DNA polymerase-3 subunit delta